MTWRVKGRLSCPSGVSSYHGCKVEAHFSGLSGGETFECSALTGAAGDFSLDLPTGDRLVGTTVKFVASTLGGRIIGEREFAAADLPDSVFIEVVTHEPVAVDVPAPQPRTPLRAAIDEAFQHDANVREALTQNLKPLRAETEVVATRVQKAFANFNPRKLSTEERARRRYVAPGSNPYPMLETVVLDGVRALRSFGNRRTLTLRDRAELRELVLGSAEATDSLEGFVELGPLINYINRKNLGTSLMARSTQELDRAKQDADAILSVVESTSGNEIARSVAALEGSIATNREADQLVKDSVNLQMKSATAPETQILFGKIPSNANDDSVQQELLTKFHLGPSDVTSYHDFHTLKIAFEHVWTEIFDGRLASLGRDLYGEYVKLKDFSGSGQPDFQVGTLTDLARLIEEVRKLSQTVEQEIPSDLRGERNDFGGDGTGSVEKGIEHPGDKPLLTWGQLDGRKLPGRAGTIEAKIDNGAPEGLVTIALQTDPGSPRKLVAFELFDTSSGRYAQPAPSLTISSAGQNTYVEFSMPFSLVALGALEFASQHFGDINVGRYLLGNLQEKLDNRSRVVFHWKDN